MGLISVTTKISSLQEGKSAYEAPFLVDTGATDSVAPGNELTRIGLSKQGKMAYELADGTVKEYSFGIGKIAFMGGKCKSQIVSHNEAKTSEKAEFTWK
uniref:Clan AA aspartic protease, AF_0612 family n=1 Tax=Candidatus Kentrum sp. FM TaxID=2126340 RepID=A0A450VL98_9GAMM|nr:MAG: hypothetical protein BECKFM1743A_GA0114220_1000221 [Candidatus Kentron sp. FM]VFJ43543.1 MAG: hypothetical protein BECKFM1743C_GA0114222_1000221 [Candidatus Kentron sp. FM]VFK05584.1 MAG: hypothetical protein BECKFM1743B_GA0114221_1000221 [Candidatus Kentron sp. FM]